MAGLSIQRFETVDDFYAALRHAVTEAKVSLDLTHIRREPPDSFQTGNSRKYFDELAEWLSDDPLRTVRRIISMETPQMVEWAGQLHEACSRLPRFKVRAINWDIETAAINLAVIDGKVVFMAITGEVAERTQGIAIEDNEVTRYFAVTACTTQGRCGGCGA